MYPLSDNEWLGIKSEPAEDPQVVGNVSKSWQWRERGTDPPNYPSNKKVFENIAEDILVQKHLQIRSCDLPGYPRSTFLMVFSPDGTKVASTHGNHNVYVSELASGKHVRILKGHPRTPWCIAFHPSHPQLIGSGCLGGQVRVWDIASGGSEVWNVRNESVIASVAFHPREQLLVIATYNELYFWDWSHPAPFTKVSTNNINEKVRYVAFDSLGYKLITGISLWACPGSGNISSMSTSNSGNSGPGGLGGSGGTGGLGGLGGPGGPGGASGPNGPGGTGGSGGVTGLDVTGGFGMTSTTGGLNRSQLVINREREEPVQDDAADDQDTNSSGENTGEAQDMIVNSYQTLVQRYDSLVRNYQRLFMVRHRLTNTPPPPNTIDRGTDPMESSYPGELARRRRIARRYLRTSSNGDSATPGPSTSRRQDGDSGDGESSGSRFLNLDILSLDSDTSRSEDLSTPERSPFTSRSSAFEPLESSRTFRTVDQRERTRLLPNPFSSRTGYISPQPGTPRSRRHMLERSQSSTDLHSSRTSILFAPRPGVTPGREFAFRRRNLATSSRTPTPPPEAPNGPTNPPAAAPSTPVSTTNSSTQISPDANTDAMTINRSLDLIRDILRDSGTRLLNLITTMSINLMLDRPEPNEPDAVRRRAHFERLYTMGPEIDLVASSSDSESALSHSEPEHPGSVRTSVSRISAVSSPRRTDRRVFNLGEDTLTNGRFRVRTQRASSEEPASTTSQPADRELPEPFSVQNFDPNVPSTSRDNHWPGSQTISSAEAFRRVNKCVYILQKHTLDLGHMWLRGQRPRLLQLRYIWENLRRRILGIQRELGREGPTGYYTRSLLERCMILTDMTELTPRPRIHLATRRANTDASTSTASNTNTNTNSSETEANASTSNPRPANPRSSSGARASPFVRRRVQSGFRYRSETEIEARRRARNPPRSPPSRVRREITRAVAMNTTRHEIRMRAMQVLSVMFNMMMLCLEERGLSPLIMHMLKALKKALALSCFMIMSPRSTSRPNSNSGSTRSAESEDVVRIQNAEHTGPVNVDGPDDPASPRVNPPIEERIENSERVTPNNSTTNKTPSQDLVLENNTQTNDSPPRLSPSNQRWSRRLAVQIAAANRNTSMTARTRRDLYMESRRQKALHRTNPAAHPLVKRRFPPVSTHRIPALRSMPRRTSSSSPRAPQSNQSSNRPSSYAPLIDEIFEELMQNHSELGAALYEPRYNLMRLTQLQALRLRTVARNRFRRLQTIRLYTPSSVFSLQSNNSDNQQQNTTTPQNNGGEGPSRRPFMSYSPNASQPRGEGASGSGQYHAVYHNVAMPIMQVNHFSPAPESQPTNQAQRLPRIHEYLQPIILAQNAMVVEEDGEGGGPPRRVGGMAGMAGVAGLLDAGIISEALPAPSNRVQAWDFTTGQTPDIADSTKNVVVQKCRIHNDASIDISKDGRLLVAMLPVTRLRNNHSWLGVYSLEWGRLGQCLHTAMLEQSAVSVALSPTARYLAVGLGSRRFSSAAHSRPTNVIALLYKLDPKEHSSRTGLTPIKELMQHWEHGFTSLNCLRWAPQPGQGLVYANNTGQLIIMS